MTLSDHCLAPTRSVDAPVDGAAGRYERLFPELPALAGEEDALLALGTAGGVCDGGESCTDAIETAAVPSGEAVANAMGEASLTDSLGLRAAGWAGETPLWLYFLAESASRGRGEQLGPCGGRIVAEVLIGILAADRGSFLANEPGWTPTLPALGHRFGLTDLLLATHAPNARTSDLDGLDLARYAVRVAPSHGQA